jgi:hypothetical protein
VRPTVRAPVVYMSGALSWVPSERGTHFATGFAGSSGGASSPTNCRIERAEFYMCKNLRTKTRTKTAIAATLLIVAAASLVLSVNVSQAQAVPVTVTWQLSINVIGDATGTILTIDGTSYTQSQLSEGLALNETAGSADHTILATSPVTAGSTKQFAFLMWNNPPYGLSASSSSGTFTWPSNASTVTANYIAQYSQTLSYSVSGGGSPTAPTFTANQSGSMFTETLTSTPTGYYFDSGSSWSVTNPLEDSTGTERWDTSQTTSGTIWSPQTLAFTYYHRFSVNFAYTVVGGGSPVAPTVSFTQYGSSTSVEASASPGTQGWVDSGSTYSYTKPLDGSASTERWDTNSATGSISATVTVNPSFYHQFQQTLSYIVTGGGAGCSAPFFTTNQFGALTLQVLTTIPSGYWFDNGASWAVTNPLGGSTSSERWLSYQTVSGTISDAQTLLFRYSHQYYLTMQVNPSSSGTTTSSDFYDDGRTIQISATANAGYAFKNWTGSGAGSFTGTSNPASVTINAAIIETAFFSSQPVVTIAVTSSTTGSGFLSVDGTPIVTPQTYSWTLGTTHAIAALNPVSGATGVQYVWQSWTDGGAQSHTITVSSALTTFTATYQQQYQLTINATLGGTTSPPPGSYWYDSGQSISVTAMANSGYDFSNWLLNGGNAGSTNQLAVTMSRAHTVVGNFEQEPSPIYLFFTTTLGRIVAIISGLLTIIGSIYGVRRHFKQKPSILTVIIGDVFRCRVPWCAHTHKTRVQITTLAPRDPHTQNTNNDQSFLVRTRTECQNDQLGRREVYSSWLCSSSQCALLLSHRVFKIPIHYCIRSLTQPEAFASPCARICL